jgi:hypothetical protein
MGWYDCYDFTRGEFTQPDTKAPEIWRVLKEGGRFITCSWEEQEDLRFMEEAILRHGRRYYPAILEDREYLESRPIGMAYEKAEGYDAILQRAGFREIQVARERMTFVSTDEEEWWQQMLLVGWESLIKKFENARHDRLQRIKQAIFKDLQAYKHADGIHFEKEVFFIKGVKSVDHVYQSTPPVNYSRV